MIFKEIAMRPEQYVEGVLGTKSQFYHWDRVDPDLLHAIMGCETEVGEMMDAIKRTIFYGKELDIVNVKEELGDLLYYVALAMHACGTSFEEVMKANHAKLKARYPDGFSKVRASERNLAEERKVLEDNMVDR